MSKSNFWNDVYRSKRINNVSWYADRLNTSLEIIKTNCSKKESSIIDIGAGRSNLVDDLHDIGYKNLTFEKNNNW
jgi:2-polyprenyl-3-methyl-5-hydroxy-6-metoxy-1,4-benzoquinol methylase